MLYPTDNRRLANLCGQFNEHLKRIEAYFHVHISNRGHDFQITGSKNAIKQTSDVLHDLYQLTGQYDTLDSEHLHFMLQKHVHHTDIRDNEADIPPVDQLIKTRAGTVRLKGKNQQQYVANIKRYDLNFAIGPAGTGKTFLAVACAVEALELQRVKRLILVRPAVEAGEKLGFLPGDLVQKVDPYLRPLYDALYEILGFERVTKLLEKGIIEIAPLAFMRGRTLNESFIILDESQNTTQEQMKMFLTRIGFGSMTVVTGDTTQIDLPKNSLSGLKHAMDVLKDVKGIYFNMFTANDVLRHPLVQRIINAYERFQ